MVYYLLFNYNEGSEGSLYTYLKIKNYISYFSRMTVGYYKNSEMKQFIFYLTDEGEKNIDKIIQAFFASVNSIKKESNEKLEEIINNIKLIQKKSFKFKEDRKTVFPDDIDSYVTDYSLCGAKNIFGNPIDGLYTLKRAKQILEELSPNKTFIFIDSNKTINSQYLNSSSEIRYTKNYNVPYKMNDISNELINNLKTITSVDNYNFALRKINDDYSKLENMTDIPCYKKEPNKCHDYNETDINSKEETEPYVINNTGNILSLMKIDRTFDIPFIRGYIELELDDDKIKEYMDTEKEKATFYLIRESLYLKYYESSLFEAGSSIQFGFSGSKGYKLLIYFSTYNDLLDKFIDFIKKLLKEPIDENTFNNLKEQYYASIANNLENPGYDFITEMINIFRRFITVDTFTFIDYPKELIQEVTYNDFNYMFKNISLIFNKLKYLTYGDISYELAISTTKKLSSILNTPKLLFKLNAEKVPNVPYNSSIYYIFKSQNKYQVQGRTLVLYEFDKSLVQKMRLYTYCSSSYLFDYLRTKRGSGYTVQASIGTISNKYYLMFYVLGKVYSPEKMDRLLNEAIKESFSLKECKIDLILTHLNNKNNIKGYIEDKFNNLVNYISSQNYSLNEKIEENQESITYESIIKDIQEVFVTKVRRYAILSHRGNEIEEDYNREVNELDKVYYFNNEISNNITHNITYLNKYVNVSLI